MNCLLFTLCVASRGQEAQTSEEAKVGPVSSRSLDPEQARNTWTYLLLFCFLETRPHYVALASQELAM